jgi:hypothetical protein
MNDVFVYWNGTGILLFILLSMSVLFVSNFKLLNIVMSPFHREEAEDCVLLGYHAANSGDFRTDFSEQPIKKPEDGIHRLLRNVGKELPLLAA